jgi:hypothetical protein
LYLPFVTNLTRERIARELDDRGPESCMAETLQELSVGNPEILDMATKCAASFEDRSGQILLELCIFYRLLRAQHRAMDSHLRLLTPFPRVTQETRGKVVESIDEHGSEAFTMSAIEDLEQNNSELLQMAHNSAARQESYLPMMQGFALLYKVLSEQAAADAATIALH